MVQKKNKKTVKKDNYKVDNSKKYMMVAVVLLILIAILLALKNPAMNTPAQYDDFAKCLTDKGVKMYGAEWCSHCKNQKKAFGKSFDYVDYVECPDNEFECKNAGVTGYPTWFIDGSNYPGEQTFAKLSELSGCPLPV
ncbi:MAG: hypothetical protein K0B07_04265 [DPANN group archaeon]|nr:hypothetical protein [DPANN group archaeon]